MEALRRPRLLGAAFVVTVALSFVPLLEPVLQNGDAAAYNEQIDTHALAIRTTHFGYMLLGMLFRSVWWWGETDYAMNLMTWLFGTIGALAVYFTVHRLTHSAPASAAAALALLCVPAYLRGMLLSEVDVPLAATVAVAFALLIEQRPKVAGATFGVAMLISPLAALTLPAFLVAGAFAAGEPGDPAPGWLRVRPLIWFATTSLAVYLPPVVAHYDNYLYSGRGIFNAPRMRFDLAKHFRRSYVFTKQELLPLLPLYALGAWMAVRRSMAALPFAVALTALTSTLVGERFSDVPVQLPTTALASVLVGLALAQQQSRAFRMALIGLVVIAIASNGAIATSRVRHNIESLVSERSTYAEMKRASPYPILLANTRMFTDTMRAERIVFGKTKTGHALPHPAFAKHCKPIAEDPQTYAIWFLREPYKACGELLKRYEWFEAKLLDRNYRLLLPRSTHAGR